MFRKVAFLALALALVAFVLPGSAQAKNTKYTFNDVMIGEEVVEIEAGVKETNKADYSNCNYYTDDYIEFLGYYQEAVSAGDTADEVLAFCVENFDNRTQ